MKLHSKIVILGLALAGLCVTVDSRALDTKKEIVYAENHLTAHVVEANLGEVLLAIAKGAKVEFIFNEAMATEKVSVSFEKLPLEEGIKRIVRPFSYSMVFGPSGQLKSVFIFEEGSTSAEGPVLAQNRSVGPRGPSPRSIDSAVGPAGPDKGSPTGLPMHGPGAERQGKKPPMDGVNKDQTPTPGGDDEKEEIPILYQPAGEMTTPPAVKGPTASDAGP